MRPMGGLPDIWLMGLLFKGHFEIMFAALFVHLFTYATYLGRRHQLCTCKLHFNMYTSLYNLFHTNFKCFFFSFSLLW